VEEEEARRKVEEDEARKVEEEARRKVEEEARRKVEEEARRKVAEEARRKVAEDEKKRTEETEEDKYLLCLEKLKLMEEEIEEKEKKTNPFPKPAKTPTISSQNHYIKLYAPKLQTLYEAGFQDIQRNLYLLITFNGNIDTVIDKLLQDQ